MFLRFGVRWVLAFYPGVGAWCFDLGIWVGWVGFRIRVFGLRGFTERGWVLGLVV